MRPIVLVLALLACGGKRGAPVEPVERPPLPPSSTSPIALLVQHDKDLELSAEQREKLAQIDKDLTTANRPLEGELEKLDHARPPSSQGAAPPTGGMGGRGMGGMGGGPPGGGGKHRGGHRPRGGSGDAHGGPPVPERAREIQQRLAGNTSAALAAAVCVLRDDQRVRARPILDGDGYEMPEPSCR